VLLAISKLCSISVKRLKLLGEIEAYSVKQSGDEEDYQTEYAIDRDWSTTAPVSANSDGSTWIQVNFTEAHCINQVMVKREKSHGLDVWNCTEGGCNCDNWVGGDECRGYKVTISKGTNNVHSQSGCATTGSIVELKRNEKRSIKIWVTEIIITKFTLGKFSDLF
jgi:hypothetical protein